MFELIPAIDIRGGRCVRLLQGDYERETAYGEPLEMARRWEGLGATRLHVVDLDGARDGVRQNARVIGRIAASVSIPIQVGGGIRSLDTARDVLSQGVDRVALGTAAVEQTEWLAEWVEQLGAERIVVGVDARGERVATHGWLQTTEVDLLSLCQRLAGAGVPRIFYTDIARDGLQQGPNLEGIRRLVRESGMAVIASGGVATADHVRRLAEAGAEGAIVGKALYDGRLALADALAASRRSVC